MTVWLVEAISWYVSIAKQLNAAEKREPVKRRGMTLKTARHALKFREESEFRKKYELWGEVVRISHRYTHAM